MDHRIKSITVKTIKHSEYRSKLYDHELSKAFLDLQKKDKLDYIEINFCSTNNIIKKVKKQSTKLDKIGLKIIYLDLDL